MSKTFKVADLANPSHDAGKSMVADGVPTTCYDLAVFSLVKTGDLDKSVFDRWRSAIPKANTLLIVDPRTDCKMLNPYNLPKDSIIGFYRRATKGIPFALQAERDAGWGLYHMVRTLDVSSLKVLGGNNGDRNGTTAKWSQNDITKMFDWTGVERTSMWTQESFPAADTYGVDNKQQFVAFSTPITTVIRRLNLAFPGQGFFSFFGRN